MLRLPARKVIPVAIISFACLVVMQIAWIISAYDYEKVLYVKAQKQFESQFSMMLLQDSSIVKGLNNLVKTYREDQRLSIKQEDWFYLQLMPTVDTSWIKIQNGVYVESIAIIQRKPEGPGSHSNIVVMPESGKVLSEGDVEEAGDICIDCTTGIESTGESYHLLLFYKPVGPRLFKRLGWLIIGSVIFLAVMGYLFRQIAKMYRQEKILSEAKNDFINNLSHEMQTPVFAIQMANRLLSEKKTDDNEFEKLTGIIAKEAGHLKSHATKILELASLENQVVELERQRIDINQLIKEKLPTIRLMAENRNGKLSVHYHQSSLYAMVDPVHLNNVLVSLTDNAIKYSPSNPALEIETHDAGGNVLIKVKDKGIGIEKKYLPYVFEKFYRVPGVHRHGTAGFGLGLNYVKQVVELHKGHINIESEPGAGVTVSVYLPKLTADA
jgi:signal transduction histidine kinase